ncbi:MAG: hypothetical protein KGH57_04135 [Candidatus Micrarchaeota archaeon]|nr:hypothetical protein [Candidatus Micrarchaeota archaeon]
MRTIDLLLVALLVILPLVLLYTTWHLFGTQWDMAVRYLNGKTLLDFLTHQAGFRSAFMGEFLNNRLYYFEPYREPLSTPIFAFLLLLFKNPVLPFILLAYFGYLFAVYKLAKEMKMDTLAAFSAFTNVYAVYYLFVPNGGEALAITFVLLGLVCLLRKSPLSGLLFGIAGLAKYPALIAFPMVLLLRERKKILQAVTLEIATVVAWAAFDYAAYGVPFYSYIESAYSAVVLPGTSAISALAAAEVAVYPAIFAAVCLAFFRFRKARIKIKKGHLQMLASFAALALVGYLLILPHNDLATQARYGFLFSTALLLPAALLLSDAFKRSQAIKYGVALAAIVALASTVCAAYYFAASPKASYYNYDNANSIYAHAYGVLSGLGLGGCRFVTNAWVPMVYAGYDAYSPFVIYDSQNATLAPLEGYGARYVGEQKRYPILLFNYTGVSRSFVLDLNGSRVAYQEQDLTVYLPQNINCYRD